MTLHAVDTRPGTFAGRSVLSVRQYDRADLERLFDHTDEIARLAPAERLQLLRGRILVSAFYQTSTRTRLAHEAAMIRLGGAAIGFADPAVTRAGDFYQESLGDVTRMMSIYGDILVIRHPTTGAPAEFARHATVPVINAGDGWGEHPTQALVDLYTIRQARCRLDGTHVCLLGDLRMRTMRSVLLALRHYRCKVTLVAPADQAPDESLLAEVATHMLEFARAEDIRDVLAAVDVVYMEPVIQPDYTLGRQQAPDAKPVTPPAYRVDADLLRRSASPDLLVLHSLPRQDELAVDVDGTPHNGYWREAANGVTLRMALLDLILR